MAMRLLSERTYVDVRRIVRRVAADLCRTEQSPPRERVESRVEWKSSGVVVSRVGCRQAGGTAGRKHDAGIEGEPARRVAGCAREDAGLVVLAGQRCADDRHVRAHQLLGDGRRRHAARACRSDRQRRQQTIVVRREICRLPRRRPSASPDPSRRHASAAPVSSIEAATSAPVRSASRSDGRRTRSPAPKLQP